MDALFPVFSRKRCMKKGRHTLGCRPFCFRSEYLIAAVTGCAAASAGGVAGVEFNGGINFKPVSQKIDLYGLRLFIELFFHDKLKAVYIEDTVVVLRLVQSQRGAPSALGIQKDPNRRDLFPFKIFLNLFRCFLGYFNHSIIILLAYFQLSSGDLA